MAYATIVVGYDGGGSITVNVPEKDFLDTRTTSDGRREALVETGGDGGGKNTEWVRIKE